MDPFYNFTRYRILARNRLLLLLFKKRYTKFLFNFKYAFREKYGLEIGGPSQLFTAGIFPVYEWAQKIDGCNFSDNTLWEGLIGNNQYAYSPDKSGTQYIMDGSQLSEIEDEKYDFLLSSHNLEHIANPIKAIKEWVRVLKPGGFMLLVLPNKRFTFDHKRQYTSFTHLLTDFESNIGEDDLTHLSEILKFHDLKLDPGAGNDYDKFKKRGENNFEFRALHHHVFSGDLLKEVFTYFNLNTIFQCAIPPHHQIILGQK